MNRRLTFVVAAIVSTTVAACSSGDDSPVVVLERTDETVDTSTPDAPVSTAPTPTSTTLPDGVVGVSIDLSTAGKEISPLIVGMSGDLDEEQSRDVGLRYSSWGGNPASRYNYMVGHAWNHGADFEFRNTNYGATGDAARDAASKTAGFGAQLRLAVPMIGWVARNDDGDTCSFPDDDGGCRGWGDSNCEQRDVVADPERANVRSTPEQVAEWVGAMVSEGLEIGWIAMDNEPELWGYTHYDIHPTCATYEEILDTYLAYATAIDAVAPDAQLMGPVACCWFDYWNTAPGPEDGSGEDYLTWFLRKVREHDEQVGRRTLDALDVHFYPQTNVYNDDSDDETNARRLRSTRALWDPTYNDESWIGQRIQFIPRMLQTIERSYPGTRLAITEWNFGADTTMNGAVTIAEVLGIYGREGVDAAAYWRNPPPDSPGYFAFKMHGNYDGQNARFGGAVVGTQSSDPEVLSAYGALDQSTGVLRVMLVNKDPLDPIDVALSVAGGAQHPVARRWTYGPADPAGIVSDTVDTSAGLTVSPSSIVVLELDPSR